VEVWDGTRMSSQGWNQDEIKLKKKVACAKLKAKWCKNKITRGTCLHDSSWPKFDSSFF
jgi:hypothetical protein